MLWLLLCWTTHTHLILILGNAAWKTDLAEAEFGLSLELLRFLTKKHLFIAIF